MQRSRDLIVANVLALLVLLVVLLVGWREAAAFGLVVLVILDLMVVLRERSGRSKGDEKDWPEISYEQARAAYEAGQKLHLGGQIYLVRRALREPGEGLVLWIADECTPGDHGLLLFPDGRVEAK
jgi:hypothetical protein